MCDCSCNVWERSELQQGESVENARRRMEQDVREREEGGSKSGNVYWFYRQTLFTRFQATGLFVSSLTPLESPLSPLCLPLVLAEMIRIISDAHACIATEGQGP